MYQHQLSVIAFRLVWRSNQCLSFLLSLWLLGFYFGASIPKQVNEKDVGADDHSDTNHYRCYFKQDSVRLTFSEDHDVSQYDGNESEYL